MSSVTKDLGPVTAYAYAVAGGYEGTEAEFTQLVSSLRDGQEMIAEAFDSTKNYSIGQYCIYSGNLYRFTSDHSAGNWNSSHVSQVVLGDEVGELKSATDAVTDQTNLFNKNAVTDGKRLDGSGAPTNGTDYYVSEYIPVQAGCYYYKNSPTNDAYHRMCVYAQDFAFITGEIYTENFVQIPSTGAYIRICGLKTEKDTTVIKAMIAIDFSTREAIARFEKYLTPKNIFDGKFSDGFLGTNGQVTASDSYIYSTDYIPVNAGEVLTWWFYSTTQSAITSATVRFVTAYDITKTAISASGASETTHSYTVPDGIAYIRFTYSNNSTKTSVMCVVNESGTPSKYEAYFEPYYGFSDNVDGHYTIRKKVSILATDGIDGFYSKMSAAYELGNCDVNIEQGTYTFTNALIEAIRATGRRGIPIGNGCKYYFNGAKVYCEYTGSSVSDIVNFFSPLDSQNIASDYEIHNLDLVAKNVVYGIHDEANGGNFCRHIYEDCNIELDNTYLGSENGNAISKALGGGLAAYEEVIIRNCIFKATNPAHTTQYQNDASYHGANGSTFTDAKIVVDGCYFENIFRCSNLDVNTSTPYPKIIYTNNSCSGRNVDLPGNWTKFVWNNELRT